VKLNREDLENIAKHLPYPGQQQTPKEKSQKKAYFRRFLEK
jgi:hypothetical protein